MVPSVRNPHVHVLARTLTATRYSIATGLAAVERQQLAENVVVRDVSRPTVRGSHSHVDGFVCVGESLRAGVVEVRQHAFLERIRRFLVARNGRLRITGNRLVDPLDPLGRVEPAVT